MYRDEHFSYALPVPPMNSGGRRRHYNFPNKSRIYAISDIHGCLPVLEESLELIKRHLTDNPSPLNVEPVLLTQGDLIDKGPDSCAVIGRSNTCGLKRVALMGNHEEGLIHFVNGPDTANTRYAWLNRSYDWLLVEGGVDTLKSYGLATHDLRAMLSDAKQEICADAKIELLNGFRNALHYQIVAAGHTKYFQDLRGTAAWRHFIFCHAQINPEKPLDAHSLDDVIHGQNYIHYTGEYVNGAVVVHGHTTKETQPIVRPYSLGIDPAAINTGRALVAVFSNAAQVEILTRDGTQVYDYPRARNAPVSDVRNYKTIVPGCSTIRVRLDPRKTREIERRLKLIGPETGSAKRPPINAITLSARENLFQRLADAHHVDLHTKRPLAQLHLPQP